jgi:ABC-type uncharacterized transport system auxiliary subunit
MLLPALAAGCDMSKPSPDKTLFTIDPGQPTKTYQQVCPSALRVYAIRVASPSDAQTFLYKRAGSRYETDYYNGFIAPPERLLTGTLIDWAGRSGLFAAVVDSGSRLNHRYVLEGMVSEMCGDYSDPKAAKASITASFFIIDDEPIDNRVVFNKTYKATAPIAGANSDAMAAALNAAYRTVLTDLTEDLSGVKFAGAPSPAKAGAAVVPAAPGDNQVKVGANVPR